MQPRKKFNTCKGKSLFLLLIVTVFFIALSDNAFAVNLVQNPHIDGSLTGWNAGITTYDSTLDATGVAGSGSAQHIFNWGGGGIAGVVAMYQCITTFVPGRTYTFGGKVYIPSSQTRMGTGSITISWFTGTDCTTGNITYSSVGTSFFDTTGTWISLDSSPIVAPLNAGSVWFTAQHGIDDTGTHQTNFDDLYLDDVPSNVPTLTQWGMIIFALIAGFGAVLYLRKQKRTSV